MMKRDALLVAIMTTVSFVLCAQQGWAGYYEDALRAANEGNFPYCVEMLNKSMNIDDDVRAYDALGKLYIQGSMVKKDVAKGLRLANVAIGRGSVDTMSGLALLYAQGNSLEKDHDKAIELWERAFKLGDAGAGYNLAHLYSKAENGPKQDAFMYQTWLQKAANAGHGDAIYSLTFELMGDNKWLIESFPSTNDRLHRAYMWGMTGVAIGHTGTRDLLLFMDKNWNMPQRIKQEAESFARNKKSQWGK